MAASAVALALASPVTSASACALASTLAVIRPLTFTPAHAVVRARHCRLPMKPWGVGVNWTVCLWRTVIKPVPWAVRRTRDRNQHLGLQRVMADIWPRRVTKPVIEPMVEPMIVVWRVLKTGPESGMDGVDRIDRMVPLDPALTLRIPRAKSVVIIPIAADAEGDDANADGSTVGQKRDACALVRVDDVARIQPAAMGADRHIAPAVIAHAAFNGDGNATAQDGHNRVIAGRPGPQVDLFGHVGRLLRMRWRSNQRCQHGGHQGKGFGMFHGTPPMLYNAPHWL